MNERAITPTARIYKENFDPRFDLEKRLWQGCPTLECTKKGTVFGGWYTGGTREPSLRNYNVLYRSTDQGFSFPDEPVLVIESTAENNKVAIDIQLWCDPSGKLWVFWVERDCLIKRKEPAHLAYFAVTCDDPDAEVLQWSEPRYIGDGFLRCKPIVLADGRWLLPAYDFQSDYYCWSESADQGKTFTRKTGGKKVATNFEESMFYEIAERSEIHLLARTTRSFIARSSSFDNGKTWSDGVSNGVTSASSRNYVKRLRSGKVLLITNDHETQRTNLKAYLSDDGGSTWKWTMMLDNGSNVSYPDAAELPDGSIVVIYDHGRPSFKEVLTARFTQEDIMNGGLVESPASKSYLKQIISKAPAITDLAAYEKLRQENEDWVQALCEFWG